MKDIATDLMEFDAGNLNARETLELFALLVASGLAWTLQGTYGRTARVLINEGWISPFGGITEYGNEMLEAVA